VAGDSFIFVWHCAGSVACFASWNAEANIGELEFNGIVI